MKNLKDLEETIKNLAGTHKKKESAKRGTKRPLRLSVIKKIWRKEFSHLLSKKTFIALYEVYYKYYF